MKKVLKREECIIFIRKGRIIYKIKMLRKKLLFKKMKKVWIRLKIKIFNLGMNSLNYMKILI